jgi:hypothetical protein
MPKLIATHDVDDVAHWLASPKRAEVFAGIATNLQTYVLPGGGKRVVSRWRSPTWTHSTPC